MPAYDLASYDKSEEENIKADARLKMFFALRAAFKDRSGRNGVTAKDLAQAIGKNKGQVSRVLNGRSSTITFETLMIYLEALGFVLHLKPEKVENIARSNFDARPFDASRLRASTNPGHGSVYTAVPLPGSGSVINASA